MQSNDIVFNYYHDIHKENPLEAKEELKLISKAQKGDEKAKDKVITSNLKFVITIAKKYQNQGLPLIDLINEGNIGLIKAIDRFEVSKGYKFISYAVWWVRQTIISAINEQSRIVRIPVNHVNRIFSSKDSVNRFIMENERLPEIGDELDNGEVVDLYLLPDSFTSESLNNTVGDKDTEYLDFLNSETSDIIPDKSLETELYNIMDFLPDREHDIVLKYYGMMGNDEHNLEDLANEYGITKERVRQIKEKAIRKLRHNSIKLFEIIKNK